MNYATCSSLHLLRQGLSLNPVNANLALLADPEPWGPSRLCLPGDYWLAPLHLACYMGDGGLEEGSVEWFVN